MPENSPDPVESENIDPLPQAKKPWPLSWILIVILAYIAFQTIFFLFFAD
ncbi:hypothetical protein G0Q06_04705 [Puniceicoccales bacterium CK1056]|uniref:Uncharacterized protein n=1 Tax=Oceanipulchritudo coccoides TaxID=2706888 RepID=A0A6B2LZ75_9BACT|nr:hypothetical protein [Oceanipulchritudo coccoides]NDV61743.1 hypothetical protein [Oceanipulchritudo coccoides]